MTTENLSDISVMLEAYRDELVRGGFSEQALRLRGLQLHDTNDAHIALGILNNMPHSTKVADCVRGHLMGMLNSYLSAAQLAS
jgi:hypothetical protein